LSRGSKLSQILSKNLPEAIGSFTRTGMSLKQFRTQEPEVFFILNIERSRNRGLINRILKTLSQRFLTKSKNHPTTLEKITQQASTKQSKTRQEKFELWAHTNSFLMKLKARDIDFLWIRFGFLFTMCRSMRY
jgi:hypothetical protein